MTKTIGCERCGLTVNPFEAKECRNVDAATGITEVLYICDSCLSEFIREHYLGKKAIAKAPSIKPIEDRSQRPTRFWKGQVKWG